MEGRRVFAEMTVTENLRAGTIWPDDGEQLSVVDMERHTVDRLDPFEGEVDVIDLEEILVVLGAGAIGAALQQPLSHESHLLRRL